MKKVKYHKLRLPEEKDVLREYIKESVNIKLDEKTGKIIDLKLLRLMVDPKK